MAEGQDLVLLTQARQELDTLGAQEANAREALVAAEDERSRHTSLVRQLTEERRSRFRTAVNDLYGLAETGEVSGDTLVSATKTLAAHSPDSSQSKNVQEVKDFGATLLPGSVLCNFNKYGLPIICHLSDDPGATHPRPVLLERDSVHSDELKLGYEITVTSMTKLEPQTVIATPDRWLVGKEAVIEKLRDDVLGTNIRSASSIQKAGFSVRALRYVGETELVADHVLATITFSAVSLFQDLLRRRSNDSELDMLATFLHEHAPEELEKIYDDIAVLWASKELTSAISDHLAFLATYIRATTGYYEEGVTFHTQNDLLLTGMQKLTERGRELIAKDVAAEVTES